MVRKRKKPAEKSEGTNTKAASLRRRQMIRKFSQDRNVREMILRGKVLSARLCPSRHERDPPSPDRSTRGDSTSTGSVADDETMPQVTKMEHFKKRLIHQMELLEQKEDSSSPTASGSDCAPEVEENDRSEGKEKKERKKRISRKLFRHQNIEIFKPANDKSTGFLRQIHGRNSPPEGESKTDTIVHLLQGNGENNETIGKHHLPPMILDFPLHKRNSESSVKSAQKAIHREQSISEKNLVGPLELTRSKSVENHTCTTKPTVPRRKSVCAINGGSSIEESINSKIDRTRRGRPSKVPPMTVRRKTVCCDNYEAVTNMEDNRISSALKDQPALDLTTRHTEAAVGMFPFQNNNFIQYNPLTINQMPQMRPDNILRQQSYPPHYRYMNIPKPNTVENDASMKVFKQLLPSFIANNDKPAVLVLNQKIALTDDNSLSPEMRKCKDQMLNDISRFLRGKPVTPNGKVHAPQPQPYFIARKETVYQNNNRVNHSPYNPDMFKNVEALATPSQTQAYPQDLQNTSSLRNYRRQMGNKQLEPYAVKTNVNYNNNVAYNGHNGMTPSVPNQNHATMIQMPHTTTFNQLEEHQCKPGNGLAITKGVAENVVKKVETKSNLHSVQFLIPALKTIDKNNIPSVTEKVIPLEISKRSSAATPLTEKVVNVEINSQGFRQNLIVKEKELKNDSLTVEKLTTSRGTSPIPIKYEVCTGKTNEVKDVVEITEVKEEVNKDIKMEIQSEVPKKEIKECGFQSITNILQAQHEEPIVIKDDDDDLPQEALPMGGNTNQKRKSLGDLPILMKKSKSENSEINQNVQNSYSAPSLPDLNKNYIVANKNQIDMDKNVPTKKPPLIKMEDPPLIKMVKKLQDLSSHDVKTLLKGNIVAKHTPKDNPKVKGNSLNISQEVRNRVQNNIAAKNKTTDAFDCRNNPSGNMDQAKMIGIGGERPIPPIISNANDLLAMKKDGMISPNYTQNNQELACSIRRNSFDTVSSLSDQSYQEEMKSPVEKRAKPRGKLRYDRMNNTFERYFDDIQEKLYLQNVVNENSCTNVGNVEVIKIPHFVIFQREGTIDDVTEFTDEFKKVEQYAPSDFYKFYRYVAGYQMLNNQSPIAFKTFLDLFNTRGLDNLLVKYLSGG